MQIELKRHPSNPLITPEQVPSTRDDFEVACVMNAGAIQRGSATYLMLRVDERPIAAEGMVSTAMFVDGKVEVRRFPLDMPGIKTSDSRGIGLPDGTLLITVLSHLRVARSEDGVHFDIDAEPAIFPSESWEAYAAQDSRMVEIDGVVYINYSAVSDQGVATALASTHDFLEYEKHGIIFLPDNRNVCLFPEKIGGGYCAMSRPMHAMPLARNSIWLSRSADLRFWGDHRLLMRTRPGSWDCHRIGGGAPPIETEDGWLLIYHGADASDRYCLGAALLDRDDPTVVRSRLPEPILQPEESYERQGFFGNVVFTDGAVVVDDNLHVYYGASDETTCLASIPMIDLLESLKCYS